MKKDHMPRTRFGIPVLLLAVMFSGMAFWPVAAGTDGPLPQQPAAPVQEQTAPAAAPSADRDQQLRLICAGMGFQNGYLDGFEIGTNDRQYRGQTDIKAHPLYEKGERGYDARWSFLVVYQNAYREGFERGCRDGLAGSENLVVARFAQLENALQANTAAPAGTETARPAASPAGIVIPAGCRVLLALDGYLTTRMNQRGDPFSAIVQRDVFAGNHLVIPEGTVILGTVGQVDRPGRVSGRAQLSLRFEKIRYANGNELPLSATLTGVGESRGQIADPEGTYEQKGTEGKDATVIAGAAGGGAVIGAIAGGGKGSAIGAAVGGLLGLAGILSTRGEDIELVKGTLLEIMLDRDLPIESLPGQR